MQRRMMETEDKFSDMRLKVCGRSKRDEIEYKQLIGSDNMRMRLLLSTLTNTPITISNIRTEEIPVGIRPYEVSLLRLLMKISDDCFIQINDTGTRVKYKPGTVMGGRHLEHNCGTNRAIGYFLEPLLLLALFGKNQLSIKLTGITNYSKDPSVDTFRSTTIPILKRFGIPSDALDFKIKSRGVPPNGGGEVELTVSPIMQHTLKAVNCTDGGVVKSIRGFTFSARVNAQFEHQTLQAARAILDPLLHNIHIYPDHKKGPEAGLSPGYGISLVAETTSGCFFSADTTVSNPVLGEEDDEELSTAEGAGEKAALDLLNEIEKCGVVDSTHQGLMFLLCALSAKDVSKIRVGELLPYGKQVLQLIYEFLNVKFFIEFDPSTKSLLLTSVGHGLGNLSRKAC